MGSKKADIRDFDAIVRDYQMMVFRTAMGFTHITEDAEDITQEVFIRAYRNIGKFRGDSEISTWLYRITVNLSLNFVAQRQRKGILQAGGDALRNLFNRPSDEKTPHRRLEEDEEREYIRAVIDSLPDKQRTAFILTRYEDLPQKEVAVVMGISQRAVEQLLLRAKANLNKKLTRPIRKH